MAPRGPCEGCGCWGAQRRPFNAEASASLEADLAQQANTTVLADIALPIETAQDYAAPADAGSGSED